MKKNDPKMSLCSPELVSMSKLVSSWQKPTSLAVEDRCQEAVKGLTSPMGYCMVTLMHRREI